MEKIQELELMDKILREIEDLTNSQTSVLKKVSQIAAHNITLGAQFLDDKLPDLEEHVDKSLAVSTELTIKFREYRDKFFTEKNMAAKIDPTA